MAMFGRNGEAPVPIVAPRSPADCFDAALEAARIAVTYRTPVFLLSDGYLANGSEPWQLPDLTDLPLIDPAFARAANSDDGTFLPYLRDPETLARPWAIPGTAGLEHRIGGIEKQDGTGNISYDPANHDLMVRTRQAKVDRIAETIPERPGRRPDRSRPGCWSSAGDRRTDRSARRAGRCARPAIASLRPTCAISTRSRRISVRCCTTTTGCSCRR